MILELDNAWNNYLEISLKDVIQVIVVEKK